MKYFVLILLFTGSFFGCVNAHLPSSDSKPISHQIWDSLLKEYVDEQGMVNYQGLITDSLRLNEYLDLVSANHPNQNNWTKDQSLAYWINAYNAFTVQLIIRNYPLNSIQDIAGSIPFVNTTWDIKFIHIEGETYDLNNLEHGIIRKEFKEPRIHFALVCAAVSCPRLRNEAFIASKLDQQLEEEASYFFNNPAKNKISTDNVQLSKLMDWYWGDFKDIADDKISYVNRYSRTQASQKASVSYLDYNWDLNSQ